MLPTMGGPELLIILVIILLLFGAKRVPELGRSLGRGIREFRQGTTEAGDSKDEVQDKDDEKPSLNAVAPNDGTSHVGEAETTHIEQKS